MTIEPLAVSIKQTCDMLGLGKSKVYKIIACGDLKTRKAGAKTLVDLKSIRKYYASLPAAWIGKRPHRSTRAA